MHIARSIGAGNGRHGISERRSATVSAAEQFRYLHVENAREQRWKVGMQRAQQTGVAPIVVVGHFHHPRPEQPTVGCVRGGKVLPDDLLHGGSQELEEASPARFIGVLQNGGALRQRIRWGPRGLSQHLSGSGSHTFALVTKMRQVRSPNGGRKQVGLLHHHDVTVSADRQLDVPTESRRRREVSK